jgi:very-short-patch-repair endonuclease
VPASAIPGWPADVPLPSDPIWKRDYAASVRRLVRDGIDVPLANLFMGAARPIPSDAEGANRARSASEAFLYRRLETLRETRGRFDLNAMLPIAFDGTGRMEVDLLCSDARLAVEVDGGLHLADPVAYRRDRRKDQLLQENGYLVLRFLAEDLGKELEAVLDSILRSLASRRPAPSSATPPAYSTLMRHYVSTSRLTVLERRRTDRHVDRLLPSFGISTSV